MRCSLITQTINGRTFIGGYYSDPKGIDLPDKIALTEWTDAYGNFNWELLPDGSIVAANVSPTAQQVSDKQDKDWTDKASPVLVKLIVKAVKNTAGPAQSWSAIDAAIRSLLNGS